MAEIDPRIRQFEEEAAKTLAAMKRSRARAEAFVAEEDKGKTSRTQLDQRVRQEVAADRIKGETIGEAPAQTAQRTETSLQRQSSATREAAKEQERMTRLQTQARVSEERLAKARSVSTKEVLTQAEAERRFGQYAGQRYIQRQGPGATVLSREEARAQAVARQGEFAGGKGFDRAFPPPPPPPPPPKPPTGGGGRGGGFDDEGARRFNTQLREERANLSSLESQLARSTAEQSRLIQVQASGSNVLRRNGALTTEFIQAAARGEVTIRELGYQTAATIGKFGGWITAGAALYGALGAVQKMGQGALQSYSGVNQLNRVINEIDATKARREFSQLADYFQLPYSEVTEGVYEIGKVFHDQNTALEASKALLYSVKVGELDTATAGRYLISITNAYNLSAKDLNSTFDKFNQLQNNFGVAISGTESATARAAGSFANAGGELDYLIALIGTASRVTGAAPERIGTALQRSPSFIHKPANEAALKSFGINPSQDIDKIFEEAFKLAQNQSGKRRRQLAAALFGPQYGAAVGTPLLRQYDVFKRIQASISKSEGSGARELHRLKESPEEQLKDIGIQLERLGAGLAESGLLSLLEGTVLTLDDALRAANSLVTAFNELPDGLRTALGIMAQIAIVSRLIGRFNIGGGPVTDPNAGAGRTFLHAALGGGERRDARLIRKGLYDEKTALEDERVRAADEARKQQGRAVTAETRAVEENKRRIALMEKGVTDEKTLAQSKANEAAYLREAEISRQRAISANLDTQQHTERLNEVQRRIQQGRTRFGRLNVGGTLQAADERRGMYYPTTAEVPTTQPPAQYKPGGGVQAAIPPINYQAAEQEMAKADRATTVSKVRMSRVKVAAGRLGGAFNSMIGNVGNILFAVFTIGTIAELLSSQADAVGNEIESISASSSSAQERAKRLKELTRGSQSGDNFKQRLTDLVTEHANILGVPVPTFGIGSTFGLDTGPSTGQVVNETEAAAAASIRQELRAQRRARKHGEPVPYRYVSEIEKDIVSLKSGNVPTRRARELIEKYREELALSYEATNPFAGKGAADRVKAAEAKLRSARAENAAVGKGGLHAALANLEPKEVQEHLEAEITQAGFFGGLTKNRIKRARQTYASIASRLAGAKDPEDIQLLDQARNSFYEGLQGAIQDELDHALALARTPRQTNRAYAQAFESLKRSFGGKDKEVQRAQERLRNLQKELRDEEGQGLQVHGFGTLTFGGDPKTIKQLQQRIAAQKTAVKGVKAEAKQRDEFLRQIQQELREQQYEENSALREAQTNLKASRTSDPLAQARIKLQAINREIGIAIEVYGHSSKEVLELLTQRQEILTQQAQDQLNLIDAQGSLRSAGLIGKGNEAAKARADLQTLESKLAFMRSHENRFNPTEILQLQAQIREGQIQLQEQVQQEAEELAESVYDIRIARAQAGGNDVRAARIALAKAQYEFHHADTKLERRQARADIIGKRAAVRDAVVQQQIEDIEFQSDIGKLTLDQQIAAYQRILQTQKLTRDARRDLRRKIYALRHESENDATFDLNVGNIKLPTIYEVRRAAKGGINSGGVTVHQTNNYSISGAGDPKEVAFQISRISGGANKAAMRSAGVR